MITDNVSSIAPVVVAVSDSTAPISLQAWLSRCPGVDIALRCSVRVYGNDASSVLPYVHVMDIRDGGTGPCDPASLGPALLQFSVIVGAVYGTASGEGTLSCRAIENSNGGGRSLGFATLELSFTTSLWPNWEDAIVVSTSGTMISSRLRRSVNATLPLMQFSSGLLDANLTSNLSGVVLAAQSVWEKDALPQNSASSSGAYSLTLTGATVLVLRASQRAFRPGMTVRLGSVLCPVGGISEDGKWMAVVTPQAGALCVTNVPDSADCGYLILSVNTSTADCDNLSCNSSLGTTLQCPPFCPGVIQGGSVVPFPLADGAITLADVSATAAQGVPPVPLSSDINSLSTSTSTGIYYALACASTRASKRLLVIML